MITLEVFQDRRRPRHEYLAARDLKALRKDAEEVFQHDLVLPLATLVTRLIEANRRLYRFCVMDELCRYYDTNTCAFADFTCTIAEDAAKLPPRPLPEWSRHSRQFFETPAAPLLARAREYLNGHRGIAAVDDAILFCRSGFRAMKRDNSPIRDPAIMFWHGISEALRALRGKYCTTTTVLNVAHCHHDAYGNGECDSLDTYHRSYPQTLIRCLDRHSKHESEAAMAREEY